MLRLANASVGGADEGWKTDLHEAQERDRGDLTLLILVGGKKYSFVVQEGQVVLVAGCRKVGCGGEEGGCSFDMVFFWW